MTDMTKPSFTVTPNDVVCMSDADWLKLVAELAYPDRAPTMVKAVELAKERAVKRIVETGCIRGWAGDGQSTLIWAMLSVRLVATSSPRPVRSRRTSAAQMPIAA